MLYSLIKRLAVTQVGAPLPSSPPHCSRGPAVAPPARRCLFPVRSLPHHSHCLGRLLIETRPFSNPLCAVLNPSCAIQNTPF